MNLTNVKGINLERVYALLYQNRTLSKPEIADRLSLSLPTVARCVNELCQAGLAATGGFFESSGGRKAAVVSCLPGARIALGAEIRRDRARLCAVDLYGSVLAERSLALTFRPDDGYCLRLGSEIANFFIELDRPRDSVLGVGVSIQGSVDRTTGKVTFGAVLGADGFSPEQIAKHIPFPCVLRHDSEASAVCALWREASPGDTIYVMLDGNVGGAVLLDGSVHGGAHLPSGLIEHMTLVPSGRQCYCGKRGCMETYCSADALASDAGIPLEAFFAALRNGDARCGEVWREYLEHLASAIYSAQMVLNAQVLLGGEVARHMTGEDVEMLTELCLKDSGIAKDTGLPPIRLSHRSDSAAGAALHFIEEYLAQYGI